MPKPKIKIGFLTISDRAARGIYEDISGPSMQEWISKAVKSPYELKMITSQLTPCVRHYYQAVVMCRECRLRN